MKAYEIFSALPPATASAILEEIEISDKEGYRAALSLLAQRRKLRPTFLQNKSRSQRREWMVAMLARKQNADLAIELLQGWLVKCRKEMLVTFLDKLGIAHNGEGLIEDSPSEPSAEIVDAGVAALLAQFPAAEVAAYLHLFVEMDPDGWNHLRTILSTNESLLLVPAPQPIF